MISATSLVLDEFLTLEIRDIGRHCTGQGFMTAHAQPKLHLCFSRCFKPQATYILMGVEEWVKIHPKKVNVADT